MKDKNQSTNHPIPQRPKEEQPRERFLQHGGSGLASAELLSLILRTGHQKENALQLAERILATFDGVQGVARAEISELTEVHGIGTAKAIEIKAAMELGRRLLGGLPKEKPVISCPADAANLLMAQLAMQEREEVHLLLLDTKHRVIRRVLVYIGCLSNVPIRIAEVFRPAIKENCAAIILAHNHPSGDPDPSPEDIRMTEEIHQAGKIMGIELLDHIVIGNNRYISLKEKGLGFP